MKSVATNLKQVLEGMSEDPESSVVLLAEVAGRAIGLCESVYLYSPEARRLIDGILGQRLLIGSEFVGEVKASPEDDSPLNWDDPRPPAHSGKAA